VTTTICKKNTLMDAFCNDPKSCENPLSLKVSHIFCRAEHVDISGIASESLGSTRVIVLLAQHSEFKYDLAVVKSTRLQIMEIKMVKMKTVM